MLDIFKQFFAFNKLMKDKLVAAFFLLSCIAIGLRFFETVVSAFSRMRFSFLEGFYQFLTAFFWIAIWFIALRLACELMVAIFHINDNLSPDGGKSETSDLDPMEAAREAASLAARTASSATKSVVEKTKTKLAERRDGDAADIDDVYPDYDDTTPVKKPAVKKTAAKKTAAKKTAVKKPAVKKSAAKKTTAKKTVAKKTTAKKTPAKKSPAKKS